MSQRSSFAPAFRLLPGPERAALAALHRFCRAVDETVDADEGDSARARSGLARWAREVETFYDGGSPHTAEGRALAAFVPQYGLERRDFESFLHGLALDVEGADFVTEEDLARYCEGVASSPGYLALAIFGCPEAREYAHRLGLALQLTNVLRDAREDFARGRVYFPREDLDRFQVHPERLMAEARTQGAAGEPTRRLVEFERTRAQAWYDAAERAYRAEPPASRARLAAARGMERLYRVLFERLGREEPLPRSRPRPGAGAILNALVASWREARAASRES